MLTLRELPHDEWSRLQPQCAAEGVPLPSPETARILVEEDGGAIVAFLIVQLVPHLEPIWIDPAYRGRVSVRRLVRAAAATLDGTGAYYAFTSTEQVAALAAHCGLQRKPWTVFQGQV